VVGYAAHNDDRRQNRFRSACATTQTPWCLAMPNVSIADILSLLGDDGLEEKYDARKVRFRSFITQPKWTPEDFRVWMEDCLDHSSSAAPTYAYAFQDLVVAVGHHLGMTAEFGLYSRSNDISYDGKWTTATSRLILVEAKAAPWPVPSVHQLGSYMERYALRYAVSPDNIFGVFVIGPGDTVPVIDQIKGSEFRNRMKLIEHIDLLRLWDLKIRLQESMDDAAAARMVQSLLLPFESVNVGSLLDIIYEVWQRGEVETPQPPAPTEAEWRRSEVEELLNSAAPSQHALVAALATCGPDPLPAEALVEYMKQAAERMAEAIDADSVTRRTLQGALAAFGRSRKDRDSLVETTPEGYRLAPRYYQWIANWAGQRGLAPRQRPQRRLVGFDDEAARG
jgi:hypothetical protein